MEKNKHVIAVHGGPICNLCNKIFKKSTILRRHVSQVHQGLKKYKCDFCEKPFQRKSELDKHTPKNCSKMLLR